MPAKLKAMTLSALLGALLGLGFSWGIGLLGAPT
jgi:hypothetical protein